MKMKARKLICVCFVLSLMSLVACGGEEVTITSENVSNYFMINAYADDYSESKGLLTYDASCIWTIEIVPIDDLEVKNLKLKLEVDPTTWTATDIYTEDGKSYVDITIPKSGEIKKVMQCSYSSLFAIYPHLPECSIADAEGIIIK